MMMDRNAYRSQVLAGVGDIAKLSPDTTVKGYVALGVAISVNAGAALVHSIRVMDAYAAH